MPACSNCVVGPPATTTTAAVFLISSRCIPKSSSRVGLPYNVCKNRALARDFHLFRRRAVDTQESRFRFDFFSRCI
eukprot:165071-Pyramimonas_sp.AAC.1